MKLMRSIAILAAGAAASVAAAVHAEPLQLHRISAGAAWVVHLDMERVRATEVGRTLLDMLEKMEDDPLGEVREQTGFDVAAHLNGLTVYGGGALGEDPVIVVSVADGAEDALAQMRAAGEIKPRTRDGLAYEAVDTGDGDGLYIFETREGGRRLIVVSPSEEHLLGGARVVQGRGERMLKLPFATPSAQSFVFFTAGDVLKLGEQNMASQFLRLTERIGVDIGGDDDLALRIVLETEDAPSAQNLVQGVQGLLAFARMAMAGQQNLGEQERQALDLLNAVRMTSAGQAVTIDLSASLETLRALSQE